MSGKEPKINLMEVTPFIKEPISTVREGDLSVITFPRFRNRFLQKYFIPKGMDKGAYIRLDEHGTAVWDLIDGRNTVKQICEQLSAHFAGEKNYQDRILLFIGQLQAQGFIAYRLTL